MKLVAREPETEALLERLSADSERVSSALAYVEVLRAVARAEVGIAPGQEEPPAARARRVLARIAMIRVDQTVLRKAAQLVPATVRTLDAIHLATALSILEVEALITYDGRMSAAARAAGLAVEAPGHD